MSDWREEALKKKKEKVDCSAIERMSNTTLAKRIEDHIWSVGGPYDEFGQAGIWFVYLEAAARLKKSYGDIQNET